MPFLWFKSADWCFKSWEIVVRMHDERSVLYFVLWLASWQCSRKVATVMLWSSGAHTSVYAATSPELSGQSGHYLVHCAPATPSPEALNAAAAKELWDLSERLIANASKKAQWGTATWRTACLFVLLAWEESWTNTSGEVGRRKARMGAVDATLSAKFYSSESTWDN